MVFLHYLYSITVWSASPLTTLWRCPWQIFEPGTGSLEAGSLTTRPTRLYWNTKQLVKTKWLSTSLPRIYLMKENGKTKWLSTSPPGIYLMKENGKTKWLSTSLPGIYLMTEKGTTKWLSTSLPGMYLIKEKGKTTLATSGMEVKVFSSRMAASRSLFLALTILGRGGGNFY